MQKSFFWAENRLEIDKNENKSLQIKLEQW